jgi:hypothetical protein
MNRLLTLVWGLLKSSVYRLGGQHTPNTNQDTPEGRICQYISNPRFYNEFRARLTSARAAVSVVNLLGPNEIEEKCWSRSNRRSFSVNPPGGPTASETASSGDFSTFSALRFPSGSAKNLSEI